MIDDIRKPEKKMPVAEPPRVMERRVPVFPRWLLILFLISLVANAYFIFWGRGQDRSVTAERDHQTLIGEVGKLLALPENEAPTVATVADPSKLANQPFFAKAQAGDKVLIYTDNKKAILYRPSEKKIIEVADLQLDLK